jgi:hypothetical protein
VDTGRLRRPAGAFGQFGLVTVGRSFHCMNKDQVVAEAIPATVDHRADRRLLVFDLLPLRQLLGDLVGSRSLPR